MKDEIGSFFVVTKPMSEHSELCDILFESTITGMRLQFMGGLHEDEIELMTNDEDKAYKLAGKLLIEHSIYYEKCPERDGKGYNRVEGEQFGSFAPESYKQDCKHCDATGAVEKGI